MNAFEKAKAKYEKNRERQERQLPRVEVPEKKEEPKVKKAGPMVVTVSGPVEMVLEVDYSGTLLASQTTAQGLSEMFKRQLAVMGRVQCR